MADFIKVLLVDDNKELCILIEDKLNGVNGIKIVGVAGDGVTAIKMIRELEPDIVLLDIIIPNLDGLGVLEWIEEEKPAKRPLCIVFTAIGKDAVVQKALELGADYYMMKPVDTDILISRLLQIFNENQGTGGYFTSTSAPVSHISSAARDLEEIITNLIRAMGVTPNLAGYSYLREAVMMAAEKPERLKSISRSIYCELALNHNTNARNIDRAIRCAIDSAHKKTKNESNSLQNAYMALSSPKKPNSAQIISFLADLAVRRCKM